jgi:hypothetical protein
MGNARYNSDTFRSYSSTHRLQSRSTREVFTQSAIHPTLNPHGVRVRESRDSEQNPLSTAVAIFGDVTGSMGELAGSMLREGVDKVMRELYERKPVTDPHILFGLFGDLKCDGAPLQVSQFEADIRIVEQLQLGYLEGGGGGNGGESGSLPWYFLNHHTAIDCWEKRQKKGYCFTYSDEPIHMELERHRLSEVLGHEVAGDLTSTGLARQVQERYHTFHFVVKPGSYADAETSWRRCLGDHVFPLPDPKRLPEAIISLIQMNEGADVEQAVTGFDAETASIIRQSVGTFRPGRRIEV